MRSGTRTDYLQKDARELVILPDPDASHRVIFSVDTLSFMLKYMPSLSVVFSRVRHTSLGQSMLRLSELRELHLSSIVRFIESTRLL